MSRRQLDERELVYDPTKYAVIVVKAGGATVWQAIVYDPEVHAVYGEAIVRDCPRGKRVVFDNAGVANDFLPLLGQGRVCRAANPELDTFEFSPVELDGINSAAIVHPYDVYNNTAWWPSEVKGMPWKYHMIWTEWQDLVNRDRMEAEKASRLHYV
jgi:hypothetical protein